MVFGVFDIAGKSLSEDNRMSDLVLSHSSDVS